MKKILTCVIFFVLLILQVSFIYADEVKVKEKYMENTGYYRYYLDDDYYIESSLKLEAVISSVVKITYNDYVTVMLYKDGKPQEFSSGDYIFGDGEYTIVIKKDNKVGRINFIFDIVTEEDIDIEENFYNDVELVQSYDSKSGLYRQKMNEEYSLYTSIPNYAITNKNVKVYAKDSKQAYVVVTKDGEEVVFADGKLIRSQAGIVLK